MTQFHPSTATCLPLRPRYVPAAGARPAARDEQPALPIEPPPPALLVISQPVIRQDPSLPDVRQTAAALTQAILEALSGRRAPGQLDRWLDAGVLRLVEEQSRRRTGSARLASVRVQLVSPQAAEVAARIVRAHRAEALALRLQGRRGRWLCVALQLAPR